MLASFAGILKSQTRPTDIPVRIGGAEFVVLMPHIPLATAVAKAERLRATIASQIIVPLTRCVTSSFGVAELLPGEVGEAFLDRVDKALYQAKADGRNRVVAAGAEVLPGPP